MFKEWIELKYVEARRPRILSIVNNIITDLGKNDALDDVKIIEIEDKKKLPDYFSTIDIQDKGNFIKYIFNIASDILETSKWVVDSNSFLFFKDISDLRKYEDMIGGKSNEDI